MPEHSKYNSQNLVNLLPDWLVHFLWFLYEDIPPALRGQCLMFGIVKKTAHPTCPVMPPVLVLTATVSA